jgi:hypothetical protein
VAVAAAAGAAALTVDSQATPVGEGNKAGSPVPTSGKSAVKGTPPKGTAGRPPTKPAPAARTSVPKKAKQPPPVNPDGQAKTKGK